MDERGMTNTPMSLSTRSSRLSEANTATSRSSLNVPEHHELRKSPITERTQEAAIEPAAEGGGGKANVESTTGTTTTSHSSKFNGVTFMRPRYSRRVHSKSEPHPPSPASASGSVAGNESPAKRADGSITSDQRRVSAPVAHGSPGSSLIPKLGIRGSMIAKQPPIPPRNSSDGKCGIFPTTAPREHTEDRLERIPPTVVKDIQEPANLSAVPPGNENQPPPKANENQPTMMASRRSIRGLRRLRAGSLRGHRGRVLQGSSPHRSTQE
ncbi:uncharacterized protein TrAtP1_000224 [Trichoderma atroviride]|uniref:uncharacterized protein n=1 Tax=Hypocrea atroviridis TaxID=63577 RepID=UPI003330B5F1|nr:hypothetical protein TrAtP1_000224 [Trichoderma atroviride]